MDRSRPWIICLRTWRHFQQQNGTYTCHGFWPVRYNRPMWKHDVLHKTGRGRHTIYGKRWRGIVALNVFFMLSPDSVGAGIVFSDCPPTAFVRSFVRSFGQILLPRYLTSGLNNLENIFICTTDDLVVFWRSKVKVTAGRRRGKCITVNAGASKSIF